MIRMSYIGEINHSPAVKMIEELFLTVESIGVNTTTKILKEARGSVVEDDKVKKLLNIVSSETNVAVDRILSGTDRTDDRKIALSLCIYFIRIYCDLSFSQLKKVFMKDISALHKYFSITESSLKNTPKTDFEKKLLNHYKMININLLETNKS